MPAKSKRPPAPEAETPSNAPPPVAERSVEAALGAQVRRLRLQVGLNAAELAAQAGLSASALSKIENGQISPSLTTLKRLARALNAPMSALFAEFDERRDCSFVPAGRGMRIERRGTRAGHDYQLLGHSMSGPIAVEPYLITLAEGAQAYTSFRHEGVEFIHMLSGAVAYRHGDRVFDLRPGDSLFFDSNSAHGPESLAETPCVYLSVIIYPRRD